jgi:hypothetical protein
MGIAVGSHLEEYKVGGKEGWEGVPLPDSIFNSPYYLLFFPVFFIANEKFMCP